MLHERVVSKQGDQLRVHERAGIRRPCEIEMRVIGNFARVNEGGVRQGCDEQRQVLWVDKPVMPACIVYRRHVSGTDRTSQSRTAGMRGRVPVNNAVRTVMSCRL